MRRLLPVVVLAILGLSPQEGPTADRLLDVLEKRHRETPDPSDVRLAASRLGFDRAKIVAFVTGLSWEPYPGILRGASGTLLTGGGNPWDRALLLQALLEAGGEKTRLLKTDIAPADAAKLLDGWRARAPVARPDADLGALAKDLGVGPAELETVVSMRRRDEAALIEEILDAAKGESARIAPLVGAIGNKAAAAPKEHVWVQVTDDGGKTWLDLDPSPVELAHANPHPLTPADLGAQRRTVTIRLIMNRKGGAVPLLTVPQDLSAVAWKPVDLVLQPLPGQLPPTDKLRDMDGKGRLESFRAVKQYRAGLVIDGKNFGGIPFDLQGQTYDVDPGGRVGPAKALAGGVGKAFGGAFGGFGGGEEKPAASTLESLVLEVAVKEPGSNETVHQRRVYVSTKPGDLPVLRYSFMIDAAPLPAGERGRREVAAFAKNMHALRRLVKGEVNGVHFSQTAELPSLLLRFADARRRSLAKLGGPVVQDRVGVVAETSQLLIEEGSGRFVLRRGLDIMEDPVRLESGDPTLAYGVSSTVLECLLVSRRWPADANQSAWKLIERARLQGGKAETGAVNTLKTVRWSADAQWVVDPASGVCVGRVPSGAGQGLIEAAWENMSAVCNYSDVTGLAVGAASATGHSEADDASDFFGKACGVVGGTWARDKVADQTKELTKDLWPNTLAALGGF
jgi:hypothetical protein